MLCRFILSDHAMPNHTIELLLLTCSFRLESKNPSTRNLTSCRERLAFEMVMRFRGMCNTEQTTIAGTNYQYTSTGSNASGTKQKYRSWYL
jgi:hypothetical protein